MTTHLGLSDPIAEYLALGAKRMSFCAPAGNASRATFDNSDYRKELRKRVDDPAASEAMRK